MAAKIILVLAVVYTLLITTLSLVKLGTISVGSFHPTDKMLHTGAYFVLAFVWLFYYLIQSREETVSKLSYLKIALLVIGFGMLIEVLQGALTNYREPDWADALANSIGVILALIFFVGFPGLLKNVKHKISSFL